MLGFCALPRPQDGFALTPLPGTKKLAIEIGCGVGMHTIRFAFENPEFTIYGIERSLERFEKFKRRLANHPHIKNCVAIRGDAVPWIFHFVAPSSVDKLFLLYPNPYPKKAQQNRRWHNHAFLKILKRALVPGGTLEMATNELFYADEAWGAYSQAGFLSQERKILAGPPRSHFEKKYLERGQLCQNLVFTQP